MRHFWTGGAFLFVLAFATGSCLAQEISSASTIYGCWKVSQLLGTADVYGMTNEQIQSAIGIMICYSNQAVTAGNQALAEPNFRNTSFDAASFFKWFHAPLAIAGTRAAVSVVELVDKKGRPVRFLGDTALLENPARLIIARDGVFYLACKQAAECAAEPKPKWEGYKKIGYGHLVAPGEDYSGGITQGEAEALAKRDSQFASGIVSSAVAVRVSQTKFDAMVALAYDIGNAAFAHSELVSALNSGRPVIKQDFTQFDISNGKPEAQLKKSRDADWNLFSKGKYN